MKTCCVDSCTYKHFAKGLCARHYGAQYRKAHRRAINIKQRKWYKAHAQQVGAWSAQYRKRDEVKERSGEWRKQHPEKVRQYYLKWRNTHPTHFKKKLRTDPSYKLRRCLRKRLWAVLHSCLNHGSISSIQDLGCTVPELVKYVEHQFVDGMSWQNWGNKPGCWSLDHIYPLSRVDWRNSEEALKAVNYRNLRPIWHIDNVKKSNKFNDESPDVIN